MRSIRRSAVALAATMLVVLAVSPAITLATTGNHGIGVNKGCESPRKIGDPYTCDYTIFNLNPVDSVGDALTFTSLVDTINRPGSPNSGNILSLPGIAAKMTFTNGGAGLPSCTGLSTATPVCTLPGSGTVGQGSSISITGVSFYTVVAADYALDPVNHRLTDTVDLTWQDTCDGSAPPTNCPAGNQQATTGSSTVVEQLGSSTATDIHDAAHQTVTTVAVGTTVHDFVTVTGQPNRAIPTGNVTIDWFLNGTCAGDPAANSGSVGPLDGDGQFDATGFTFTVNSAGMRAFRAHYEGDATYTGSTGPCEPLRVVDANIQISPNGVNRVGATHTLTGHVNVDAGTGFSDAPDGTVIDFAIDSGPGSLSPDSCTTSGGTGSCSVDLTSAVTGVTTVSAHTTVTVSGVSLSRTTNGQAGNSGPATKTWVNARISIAPNATNEVGVPHTFTVTLEKDTGDGAGFVAAAGEHVDATLTDTNGATHSAPTGSCTAAGANTDAAGQCTITFTSLTPGTVTGHATATLSVAGSAPFTVATDAVPPNSGDATKVFQDANISITPDGTNRVGASHTFTAHVNADLGGGAGFGNAPDGTTITFTTVDANGATSTPNPPASCTTAGGTGSCTTTITSPTTGTSTVSAHVTFTTPQGVTLTRSTDTTHGSSGPAVKTWVNARISIAPTATNEIGAPHTFTVTLEKDTGTGQFVPAAGEQCNVTLTNGNGAVANPAGPFTLTTNASGQCSVTFTSATPGTVTGHASSTLSVGGVSITVQTDGVAPNSGDAVKTFVDANIQISPNGTNPVGATHTLTGHVNINAGQGAGYVPAPAGTEIDFGLSNSGGASATFVGGIDSCTTVGTTGECTVAITSPTAGTTTIGASTTVTVGGVALTRATNDELTGDSGDATKLWADDTVRTDIHNTDHVVITKVEDGTVVHDKAFVARTSDTPEQVPNPTGTVTFYLYLGLDCGVETDSGPAIEPQTVALGSDGTAESAAVSATADLSYVAVYSGDANYPARSGICEPLDVIHPHTLLTIVGMTVNGTSVTKVKTGDVVTVTINEKNTGDDPLHNVKVTGGSTGGSVNCTWAPTNAAFDGKLDPGKSQDFSCTFTVGTSQMAWDAHGQGTDSLGNPVSRAGEDLEAMPETAGVSPLGAAAGPAADSSVKLWLGLGAIVILLVGVAFVTPVPARLRRRTIG